MIGILRLYINIVFYKIVTTPLSQLTCKSQFLYISSELLCALANIVVCSSTEESKIIIIIEIRCSRERR